MRQARDELVDLFQSTPADTGGRNQPLPRPRPLRGCFNPRPPIQAGETTAQVDMSLQHFPFQSTPADTGGRNGPRWWPRVAWRCFNPRPPIQAGETLAPAALFQHSRQVSIHARRYRRAKPPAASLYVPRLSVFQSTPADTGGRNGIALHSAIERRHVSIHARRYRRAKQGMELHQVSINQFQSTPADTGGRNQHRCRTSQGSWSFNPRPPIQAGETIRQPTD